MITKPNNAVNALKIGNISTPSVRHWEKSTILTKVAELDITTPAFFKPIMVINNPIPGVIADFTASGIERIIASRKPTAVITIKKIPERNTITKAWPYV